MNVNGHPGMPTACPATSSSVSCRKGVRVAIIGAGAVGVSVADALARGDLLERIALTVYEPRKAIGQGNAYGHDVSTALLNRQSEFMSVRHQDPRDFINWMSRQPDPAVRQFARAGTFPPRTLFGEYAGDVFEDVVRRAPIPVEVITEAAIDISRNAGDLQVSTRSACRAHDVAIICAGTPSPADPYRLAGHHSFIGDPYPLWSKLGSVKPRHRVVILGTGLTAVDVALELLSRGHQGPVMMISRRGRLPSVRHPHRDCAPAVLTEEAIRRHASEGKLTLRAVFGLMRAELTASGIDPAVLLREVDPGEPAQQRMERHLALARSGELWQPLLIKAANDLIEMIWQRWPGEEKKKFLEEYHDLFQSLCNPIPYPSAERLFEAMREGQLRVSAGIRDAKPAGDSTVRIGTETGGFHADTVIDCTRGSISATPVSAAPLVRALISHGYGVANPFGGLTIDPASNRLVSSCGVPVPDIFLLGHLASGSLYYTNSLAMVTRRVDIVADEVHKLRRTAVTGAGRRA